MADSIADLEDVLAVLGATTPCDINVFQARTPIPGHEYGARCVDRPRRILPISTSIAMELLDRGAVYESRVASVEGRLAIAHAG